MSGFAAIQRVAHRAEDLLLIARREGRLGDAGRLEPVYDGLDLTADLLEDVAAAAREDEPRSTAYADAVEREISEGDAGDDRPAASTPDPPPAEPPSAGPGPTDATQRVRRATIDAITRTAGEVGVLLAHLRRLADDATRVLSTTRDLDVLEDVLRTTRDVGFEVSLRQRLLQDEVESMRLAHVSTLLDRYPRAVRDLCRELGKDARVVIVGGHVGVDQQVLDVLADPLLHLVRNAVDHGLEMPETREAAGKPRHGTIRLSAVQAGRFVDLLVEDDGRGIDPRSIADIAVRRGLLSEADVSRMSDREILAQLFRLAFSTRQTATDISGAVSDSTSSSASWRISAGGSPWTARSARARRSRCAFRVDRARRRPGLRGGDGVHAMPSAYVDRVVQAGAGRTSPPRRARPALRLADGAAPIPVVGSRRALGRRPPTATPRPARARVSSSSPTARAAWR